MRSLLAEYRAQEALRDWDAMLDRLPLRPGQRVLDLGCGPGAVARRLGERGCTVVGVDLDAELLRAARRDCPPVCSFLRADLADLAAVRDGVFDGLWCSFAAAYFPELAPVLAGWAGKLRRGGWLALVEVDGMLTGHAPLPDDVCTSLRRFVAEARQPGGYDFDMGGRLAGLVRRTGLAVTLEIDVADRELAFQGPAAPDVLAAWRRRFARMHGMQRRFGPEHFARILDAFLSGLADPAHCCTTRVVMLLARRP